jgi:hypothetical protein
MAKAHRIDFDDLKARSDFRAVLVHYGLTIVGHGEQAKVLCPFHDDERPSCSVNLAKASGTASAAAAPATCSTSCTAWRRVTARPVSLRQPPSAWLL